MKLLSCIASFFACSAMVACLMSTWNIASAAFVGFAWAAWLMLYSMMLAAEDDRKDML